MRAIGQEELQILKEAGQFGTELGAGLVAIPGNLVLDVMQGDQIG